MKIGGIILLVLGILNFFVAIIAGASSAPVEVVAQKIMAAIMLSGLGAFLLYRAKAKEADKKNMDEWDK